MEISQAIWGRSRFQKFSVSKRTMGFLFNHVYGETLEDADKNVFGIRRNTNLFICPLKLSRNTWKQLAAYPLISPEDICCRPTTPKAGIWRTKANAEWFPLWLRNYFSSDGRRSRRNHRTRWLGTTSYRPLLFATG